MPHPYLKLGKKPEAARPTDLYAGHLLDVGTVLPTVHYPFGYGHALAWMMLGNGPDDSVEPGFQGAGDCVLAGAAEETRIVTAARRGTHHRFLASAAAPFTGKEAIAAYSELTGYVLNDESTDFGTDMIDASSWRRHTGIADANGARHKIAAYARLDAGDFDQLIVAAYIFGIVGIGFEFPNSAYDQFDQVPPIWDDVGDDQIDGGHYVPGVGSSDKDEIAVVSWGKRVTMTRGFYKTYCDEAFVYLSEEMIQSDGTGLHGFNLEQFKADLAAL